MKMKPVMLFLMLGGVSAMALSGCAGHHAAADSVAGANAAAVPTAPAAPAAPATAAAPLADSTAASATASPPAAAAAEAPQPVVADGTLQARVRAALSKHYKLGAAHINVSSREGVVRLSGAVSSSVQIDQAEAVVSEIDGVREIDNQLKVARPQK